jgi:hypothetical protein
MGCAVVSVAACTGCIADGAERLAADTTLDDMVGADDMIAARHGDCVIRTDNPVAGPADLPALGTAVRVADGAA